MSMKKDDPSFSLSEMNGADAKAWCIDWIN